MKNRFAAALLGFFFGGIALNEFYLGNTKKAIIECVLSVLLCWTYIVPLVISIINLVRAIQYLWCESDEEMMTKYSDLPVQINR